MAELYLRRSDYDNALSHLIRSLSINTYDPQANFLFGVVNRNLGNLIDAQDGFAVASLAPDYRIASYIELAKLFIFKNELITARIYTDRILENESGNQDALLLASIISRNSGRNAEAEAYMDRLEKFSPLNHFARFEKMLIRDDS
jgi:tetratricopeptide (TPR) repeat protein